MPSKRIADIDFTRDWAAWVNERHAYWHARVKDWCRARTFALAAATPCPRVEIPLEVTRKIAWANVRDNSCHYPLPYVAYFGDAFDETIGHEVCHCFQYRVMPGCESHGDIWRMLMIQACGLKPERCGHVPDKKVVQQIGSLLVLTSNIAAKFDE